MHPDTTDNRVHVALDARGYDILIENALLERAGEYIAPLTRQRRAFIITDDTVQQLQGHRLRTGLDRSGLAQDWLSLPPGEGLKSWDGLKTVCEWLIARGVERSDIVIAFGGGVIGDLTGLAAGLVKRGLDFVQVPTSLLAQVDSSVGGKTAINSAQGKNLIGLFHQPRLVLVDLDALSSLPPRHWRAGYAEIIKYALIDDPALFDRLEAVGPDLASGKAPEALRAAISSACRAKARIVAEDERETGVRALLNLGHTFAHALERATGFGDGLLHGEAVGCGMAMAHRYSAHLGLCSGQDVVRVTRHLERMGLPVRLSDIAGGPFDPSDLLAHMRHDKKVEGGALTLILTHGIGRAFVEKRADPGPLALFLKEEANV